MINKVTFSEDYNKWLKRLVTQLNEPTNQNLIKVPKVVKPTNEKKVSKRLCGKKYQITQYPFPPWKSLGINDTSNIFLWAILYYQTKDIHLNDDICSLCTVYLDVLSGLERTEISLF